MKKVLEWVAVACGVLFIAVEVLSAAEIKVGGFGQFQYYYEQTMPTTSKFVPKRVRLRALGSLTDKVGFFVQHDFWGSAGTPPIPLLLDARMDVTLCPYAKLSAGQFCLPFGIETPISPYALDAVNYSYVVGPGWTGTPTNPIGFFPYLRDLGVMLWGSYPFKNGVAANYNLDVVNGKGFNQIEENHYKDVVGRVGAAYKGFSGGGSFYFGKTDSGITDRQAPGVNKPYKDKIRYGGDFKVDKDPFLFQAEFIQGKDDTISRRGYYALAGVKLFKVFQPVLKYDVWDPNTSTGDNQINKIAGGFNWYFSPSAKLQAIYEVKSEESDLVTPRLNDDFILQLGMTF